MKMIQPGRVTLAVTAILLGASAWSGTAFADDAVVSTTPATTVADTTTGVTPPAGKVMSRDRRENRWDRRENVRDRKEDVRDHREDIADRREDRWDAKHDGGKMDKIEDRIDRREDVRDRREDVKDRVEDRADRRENRWDANHGPDKGRPGPGVGPRPHGYQNPGNGQGRPIGRPGVKKGRR